MSELEREIMNIRIEENATTGGEGPLLAVCYKIGHRDARHAAAELAANHESELQRRLDAIAQVIWDVDNRCMAADGPVSKTLEEMTQAEISQIYKLARGES